MLAGSRVHANQGEQGQSAFVFYALCDDLVSNKDTAQTER